jgi:Uma2 family endonuclease
VLLDADQVQVFRAVDGRLGKPQTIFEPPETLLPLVLPELHVDLGELFRRPSEEHAGRA